MSRITNAPHEVVRQLGIDHVRIRIIGNERKNDPDAIEGIPRQPGSLLRVSGQ